MIYLDFVDLDKKLFQDYLIQDLGNIIFNYLELHLLNLDTIDHIINFAEENGYFLKDIENYYKGDFSSDIFYDIKEIYYSDINNLNEGYLIGKINPKEYIFLIFSQQFNESRFGRVNPYILYKFYIRKNLSEIFKIKITIEFNLLNEFCKLNCIK